jgi:hypothetical protein
MVQEFLEYLELDGGFKKQEVGVTVKWTCPLLRGPS